MNPVLDGIAPSIIRAIAARKRPGDIDLGMGEPTLRPDPRPFDAATAWTRRTTFVPPPRGCWRRWGRTRG